MGNGVSLAGERSPLCLERIPGSGSQCCSPVTTPLFSFLMLKGAKALGVVRDPLTLPMMYLLCPVVRFGFILFLFI